MTSTAAPRLASIASLTDPAVLSGLVEPCDEVRVEDPAGGGFSSASVRRLQLLRGGTVAGTLMLKRVRLDADWIALGTGDTRGRELMLLEEPRLAGIWESMDSPYIARADEQGEIALLMRDLSAHLLPDVRAPLTAPQQDALLTALARMHARFWETDLSLEWMARPATYCDLLAPAIVGNSDAIALLSAPLRDAVPRGWQSALARLPPDAAHLMTRPGEAWQREWSALPVTVVHGDVKVANFAIGDDGRVSAFDWAMLGIAPCAIDVGWYLAVNATRLNGSKQFVLARYRALFEDALGRPLPETVWRQLVTAAIVAGARMLLWSKALALDAKREGAAAEWAWWVEALVGVAAGPC